MSRDTLLVRAALAARGSTRWRHRPGQGWTRLPFSPESLEAMSDAALEEIIARAADSHTRLLGYAKEDLPDFAAELAERTPEIGLCTVCFDSLGETDEVYLAWDGEWRLYCARHRPEEHWRHINGA